MSKKPLYKIGHLFYEKLNGRVWEVTKIQIDDIKTRRIWYYVELIKGEMVNDPRRQAGEKVLIEETFKRSMVKINNLDSIPTAKTLYG